MYLSVSWPKVGVWPNCDQLPESPVCQTSECFIWPIVVFGPFQHARHDECLVWPIVLFGPFQQARHDECFIWPKVVRVAVSRICRKSYERKSRPISLILTWPKLLGSQIWPNSQLAESLRKRKLGDYSVSRKTTWPKFDVCI